MTLARPLRLWAASVLELRTWVRAAASKAARRPPDPEFEFCCTAVLPSQSRSPVLVSTRTGLLRSEEHTSELQSLAYLVCRLLLEKKKKHDTHARDRVATSR